MRGAGKKKNLDNNPALYGIAQGAHNSESGVIYTLDVILDMINDSKYLVLCVRKRREESGKIHIVRKNFEHHTNKHNTEKPPCQALFS